MVQGLKVYMVGYGPRVNGFIPGSSSGKSLVSLLEYKGFMEIPSGVCHIKSSGFLPFNCFLARAAHSGWRGCRWCRSRRHISLDPGDSLSCFRWCGESKRSWVLALNMMEHEKHSKGTRTGLEKEAEYICIYKRQNGNYWWKGNKSSILVLFHLFSSSGSYTWYFITSAPLLHNRYHCSSLLPQYFLASFTDQS